MTLAKYEEKREVWEEPLKDALVETQAHNADEIIRAAESLKKFLAYSNGEVLGRWGG